MQDGSKIQVVDWKRINLDLPTSYSPAPYADIVNNVTKILPKSDIYAIERQHHRFGSFSVLEVAFLGSIVEAQLHS